MSTLDPYRLSPLELASGLVFDDGGPSAELPSPAPGVTPVQVLEQTILAALLRPPCLVSFSGGRDSSGILAVATSLARREGLPLPIPATHRFPEADGTDETDETDAKSARDVAPSANVFVSCQSPPIAIRAPATRRVYPGPRL